MKKIFKLFIVFIVVLSMANTVFAEDDNYSNLLMYTLPTSNLSNFIRKPTFDFLENNYKSKRYIFWDYEDKDTGYDKQYYYKEIYYSRDENTKEVTKVDQYVDRPYYPISLIRISKKEHFEKIVSLSKCEGLREYLPDGDKDKIGNIESCYLFDAYNPFIPYPYNHYSGKVFATVPTLWIKASNGDFFVVLYKQQGGVLFTKEEYFNIFCSKGEINCIESENLFYEYKDKLEEYRSLTTPKFEININYKSNKISRYNTTDKLGKKAFIQYGIVFVPYRDIMEELGYEVSWQNEDKSIHCKNAESEIILYTDTYEMTVNKKDECENIVLSAFGKSFNGVSYVPLEAIYEGLAVETEFDPLKSVVNINIKR